MNILYLKIHSLFILVMIDLYINFYIHIFILFGYSNKSFNTFLNFYFPLFHNSQNFQLLNHSIFDT
ncbi:hypothetical protein D0399_11945 [Staphylococcus epidermidis]|nr:hypothetical protein [Staphylococcus epidermidis]